MHPKATDNGLVEKLSKLSKLHSDGLLSDVEFKALKAKIISSVGSKELHQDEQRPRNADVGSKTDKQAHTETDIGSTRSSEWFFENSKGERTGPFLESGIIECVASGLISRTTLLWHAGLSDWTRADLSEFSYLFKSTPPPLPYSSLSTGWIWVLASFLIWGPILLLVICGALSSNFYEARILAADWRWMLFYAAGNTLFVSLDQNQIKKGGVDISLALMWGFILVPVYVYLRCAKMKQIYGNQVASPFTPLVVWIICFVISILIR